MVRLGGGTDGFGMIARLGGGDSARPELGGLYEEGPAQVLGFARATGPAVVLTVTS